MAVHGNSSLPSFSNKIMKNLFSKFVLRRCFVTNSSSISCNKKVRAFLNQSLLNSRSYLVFDRTMKVINQKTFCELEGDHFLRRSDLGLFAATKLLPIYFSSAVNFRSAYLSIKDIPASSAYSSNNTKASSAYSSNTKASSTYSSSSDTSLEPFPEVHDTLRLCEERLKKENIPEAKLNSEYIIAHALGIKRSALENVLHSTISSEIMEQVEKMMNCRLARMPLQYILGDWDFHSITLKLRPPVFIPRPETEELVNLSLSILRDYENPVVMDVCCGSGAISLALLKNHPQMVCVAIDQSNYATKLTYDNAKDLGLLNRLTIIQGKVTEESFPPLPYDQFDLILSNPPYVLRKDLIELQPEITLYEDLRALDGGKEGLDVIKLIILLGKQYLKNTGVLLLEIDPCHRYLIPDWMKKRDSGLKISSFYKDIHGKDRFVKLVCK